MTVRVVQWATGAVGAAQLRQVIDRPELELVGLFVYTSDKVGVDAGALVDRPPTGVRATDDKSAILSLDADIVLHAASKAFPINTNSDDIVALLESGFTWLPAHLWRFDKEWRNLRRLVPWVKRPPSEYVREHVRVARALGALPLLAQALACGELSYSKVRELTRVATPDTEERLLAVGRAGTTEHVARIVRGWRRVDAQAEAREDTLRHASRALHVYPDTDGTVRIKGRLTAEVGALLVQALAAARETLYQRARDRAEQPQRDHHRPHLLSDERVPAEHLRGVRHGPGPGHPLLAGRGRARDGAGQLGRCRGMVLHVRHSAPAPQRDRLQAAEPVRGVHLRPVGEDDL